MSGVQRLLLQLLVLVTCKQSAAGDVENLQKSVDLLSRQVMMQGMLRWERQRATVNSGVKTIRQTQGGTKPYFTEGHSGKSALAMHSHADTERKLGMGEIEAILNGYRFRTTHLDFSLVRPVSNDKTYDAVEDIPFPDVPSNVLDQSSVDGQIKEMQKCFKAWKDEDSSQCDYKKHFKAVLCYLEGAWIVPKGRNYDSIHQQAFFSALTGMKDKNENYQFLPTKIISPFSNTADLKLGQWTYRVVCHPLKYHLPLKRFQLVDDWAVRMPNGWTLKQYEDSNAARFILNPAENLNVQFAHHHYKYGYLDSLMAQIPGKDNYKAVLRDDACNTETTDMKWGTPLNAANYHRWFMTKAGQEGKKGTQVRHRGYSDKNIFMAKTTQPNVVGVQAQCDCKGNSCRYTDTHRWTYAIPLEIVYLTPLSKWNPHGIKGSNYKIPYNFCTGGEVNRMDADTAKDKMTVKAANGRNEYVRASGHRIFVCSIPGVGALRQRFPIFGITDEGTYPYKELAALKKVVLDPSKYSPLFD